MSSFYDNFISLIPKNKKITVRAVSIKSYIETSFSSSDNIYENEELFEKISHVFDFDGFIFIEEFTGDLLCVFDEMHEKVNLFGFYVRNNFICRLSKEEVKNIHKNPNALVNLSFISKVFNYC